jgi:hypothetical protein
VVGFDDIFPASLCEPPLTTVHQPMRLLGERACMRLLDRIARPGLRPKVELLPTELVLRSSCGCPPGTVTRLAVPAMRAGRSGSGRSRSGRQASGGQASGRQAPGGQASGGTAPRRRRRAGPVTPS